MFSMFKKDPTKKLKKQVLIKLEQGMLAQRKGDIRTYSQLSFEVQEIEKEIDKIEQANK